MDELIRKSIKDLVEQNLLTIPNLLKHILTQKCPERFREMLPSEQITFLKGRLGKILENRHDKTLERSI